MKENDFTLEKARSIRYSAQTITDADYTDDIAFLENTPAQAECLMRSLEQTAGGIDLNVNADKIENRCFNQRNGSLKLVDKFTYLPFHLQKRISICD